MEEIAQEVRLTKDGVRYHTDKLKEENRIRRIGTGRGGYWDVSGE